VPRADNLTTFMCRLSRNLGASISWNPVGLLRPVMGLLYFALHVYDFVPVSRQLHCLQLLDFLQYLLLLPFAIFAGTANFRTRMPLL
jgi:hypothetical protein